MMHATAFSIANEIRMARTQYCGSFLVTEGDTDSRLLSRFTRQGECRTIVARDKNTALNAISILDQSGFQGVLAVVDADFDRIMGLSLPSPNVLITDTHDLDIMVFRSPAMEKVLEEFGSSDKIQNVSNCQGRCVRDILLDAASHLGSLRLVSSRRNLDLRFKGCKYTRFLDEHTLAIDLHELVRAVQDNSSRHDLDSEQLVEECKSVMAQGYDLEDLCCGHDVSQILAVGLRKAIGSCNSSRVDAASLEVSLRLGYEEQFFRETDLCQRIQQWERRSGEFRVVR